MGNCMMFRRSRMKIATTDDLHDLHCLWEDQLQEYFHATSIDRKSAALTAMNKTSNQIINVLKNVD